MKPPYYSLLAVLAALAGLVLSIRYDSVPVVQVRSIDEVDLFSELPDPADCMDEVVLELTDKEISKIDAYASPEKNLLQENNDAELLEYSGDQELMPDFIRDYENTLTWIAAQQKPDGGWEACLTAEQKKNTPRLGRNGATALALLCFLNSGYTHKQKSRYKDLVYRGLDYLITHHDPQQHDEQSVRYSFADSESQMISHALATLALCEAYGMTKDKALLPFAQGGMNYSVLRQDPASGGWAMDRTAAADLITTGWIVQGLQSGALSYLTIDPAVTKAAKAFLDRSKPTAEHPLRPLELAMWGRLAIIFGATRQTPGMAECVRQLDALGFTREDCAYNFTAYSVMRRWDDETQQHWFKARQKHTAEFQEFRGRNKGTWPPHETTGKPSFWNSRLERTCLMFLARELENGSSWKHWHLKDGPEDESFPL